MLEAPFSHGLTDQLLLKAPQMQRELRGDGAFALKL